MEYDYIIDGIYLGTNQCCATHFDKKLIEEGIDVDISLEKKRVDAPFGVNFYIWMPIENHTSPTMDQLYFGIDALEKFVAMGKRVYVHCQNGHGRAPTMVAAYLVKSKGMKVKDAIDLIRAQRKDIHLEDVQKKSLERLYL